MQLATLGCSGERSGELGVFFESKPPSAAEEADRGPTVGSGGRSDAATAAAGMATPGAGAAATPGASPQPADEVTYHRDIRPILERSCIGCHWASADAPAPFAFMDWLEVEPMKEAVVEAATSGRMPPVFGDPCRKPLSGGPLSASERSAFGAWRQDGFPEGDPADYTPPSDPALAEPSLTLQSAPLDAQPDGEVACFSLQPAIAEDTFVTALRVVPGPVPFDAYRHVLVSRLAPADAAAGGCVESDQAIYAFRPGSQRLTLPAGVAMRIPAGSGLVLSVYYAAAYVDAASMQDPPSLELWTLPSGELPESLVEYSTHSVVGFQVPPGNGDLMVLGRQALSEPAGRGDIVGITPHAGKFATRTAATLVRSDGSRECLVETAWDYGSVPDFTFAQPLAYGPDDDIELACNYDNSADRQAVVNGMARAPSQLEEGAGEFDERCSFDMWRASPYP
jgi:hypothetical protein